MKKIVGIIGGIGPYAGLDLLQKIYDNTIANSDNEHLPVILYSVPELIPDRSDYIQGLSKENPSKGINKALFQLKKCGAEYAVIACNAAHSGPIISEIKTYADEIGIEIIDLIENTVQYLESLSDDLKACVFSVKATYLSKVYEKKLNDHDIDTMPLSEEEAFKIHEIVTNKEWGIKSESNPVTEVARTKLIETIKKQQEAGVNTIILGCTELPLALPDDQIGGVNLIDPGLIAARKIVEMIIPDQLKNAPQ